jgi:flagellar biosynthesis protein FlhB
LVKNAEGRELKVSEESFEERTEEATAQRREEWKKEGRVVQSRELTGALLMTAVIAALWMGSKTIVGGMWHLMQDLLGDIAKLGTADWNIPLVMAITTKVLGAVAVVLAPIAAASFVISILGTIVQTGFVWSTKNFELDLDRLNPVNGIGRIFSIEGVVEMIKACVKFVIIGSVVFFFLKRRIMEAGYLWDAEPNQLGVYLSRNLLIGLVSVAFSMLIIAGFDFAFQKFRYEQKIRMTKQEVKEERKQSDGNPQIKGRIRAIQRSIATNKMLDAVKSADVVVTNPTHIAVALKYDKDNMFAPRVVAKGADFMAEKIKKIARENGIPCVENVPLARAMYKALKLGQFISRDLFNAVAEVLAYVYRLKGKVNV